MRAADSCLLFFLLCIGSFAPETMFVFVPRLSVHTRTLRLAYICFLFFVTLLSDFGSHLKFSGYTIYIAG
ncbi:uncharacterized protein BJ212DRAFT_1351514 [Suillus subaureus]|uniref:Uncharacterized protein n=1 Tax=Suillus subaureus TaxID=48587 RepID=A0A9P7EBS6_9AGAM|nr:uncharacterized protein BJ212DRAFT_1351514 [Suillus subaureus]KAG1817204.1 hypothetical protein BJ212DRAFT_1351514 [Suillus subaureus]